MSGHLELGLDVFVMYQLENYQEFFPSLSLSSVDGTLSCQANQSVRSQQLCCFTLLSMIFDLLLLKNSRDVVLWIYCLNLSNGIENKEFQMFSHQHPLYISAANSILVLISYEPQSRQAIFVNNSNFYLGIVICHSKLFIQFYQISFPRW